MAGSFSNSGVVAWGGSTGIQTVFGGNNPVGINEYYGADPYKPMPTSGTISANDFYTTSSKTAKITRGTSGDTAHRFGYSANAGSSYYHAESGESTAAFGSITKASGLIAGDLSCFTVEDNYPHGQVLTIGRRGSGDSGWTTCYVKCIGGWLNGTVYTFTRTGRWVYAGIRNSSPQSYGWRYRSSLSGVSVSNLYWFMMRGYTVALKFQ